MVFDSALCGSFLTWVDRVADDRVAGDKAINV